MNAPPDAPPPSPIPQAFVDLLQVAAMAFGKSVAELAIAHGSTRRPSREWLDKISVRYCDTFLLPSWIPGAPDGLPDALHAAFLNSADARLRELAVAVGDQRGHA